MPRSIAVTIGSVGGTGGGRASLAPLTPPVGTRFSTGQDLALLSGPSTAPPGAVTVNPGNSTLEAALLANPPGTTYYLAAPGGVGVFQLGGASPGIFDQAQLQTGDTIIGAPGAVLDGRNVNRTAFTNTSAGEAVGCTIKTLEVINFAPVNDAYVCNVGANSGWVFEGCNMHDNLGGAILLGTNGVIRNCWLHDNAQYGFATYKDPVDGGFTAAIQNILVEYSEIDHNGDYTTEFVMNGGAGAPLGTGQPTYVGKSGACKVWDTRGMHMHHLWIHDSEFVGIWADTNNVDFLCEDSLFDDNKAEAIFYEISYNFRIRRNTFRRNAILKGANWASRGDNFPMPAIYVSSSGGDPTVSSNYALSHIGGPNPEDGNLFEDNWDDVHLFESASRFCNSPSNTSGKVWKTLAAGPQGQRSSLGACNRPTTTPIVVNTVSGSALFTVVSGDWRSTDEGRSVSGIAGVTKVAEPGSQGAVLPQGYISATQGQFTTPATNTANGVTMTLGAGSINVDPYKTSVCRWRTMNVHVQNNVQRTNQATVRGVYPNVAYGAGIDNGKVCLTGDWGSSGGVPFPDWSPYPDNAIEELVTFSQNNVFSDNTYEGVHTFMPHDTSQRLPFATWRAAPYGQDVGSSYAP